MKKIIQTINKGDEEYKNLFTGVLAIENTKPDNPDKWLLLQELKNYGEDKNLWFNVGRFQKQNHASQISLLESIVEELEGRKIKDYDVEPACTMTHNSCLNETITTIKELISYIKYDPKKKNPKTAPEGYSR